MDTDTARFRSIDPVFLHPTSAWLKDPQSQNAYAYARNNPLKYVDPDGNYPKWLATASNIGVMNMNFITAIVPVVNDVRDVAEYATGFNIVTGTKLTQDQRDMTAIAIMIGGVSGSEIRGAQAAGDGLTTVYQSVTPSKPYVGITNHLENRAA